MASPRTAKILNTTVEISPRPDKNGQKPGPGQLVYYIHQIDNYKKGVQENQD